MSIRSVDLMILYSKTADVEKMQQQMQQQATASQQQIAEESIKKKEITKSQVQSTPKGEGGRVERKKDEQGGGGQDQRQGQSDEDEEKEKAKFKPHTGGSIDIRI